MFSRFQNRRPVRVQPFYGFRNSQKLFLPVRALRGREPNFDRRTTFGSFRTMLSQYASHEIEGLELELEFETGAGDTLRQGAVTDKEGFASFELAYPGGRAETGVPELPTIPNTVERPRPVPLPRSLVVKNGSKM